MKVFTLLVAAIAMMFFNGVLFAQTPDNETPADEEICNGLVDATPGLYGLCVAYCEAQDCDALDGGSGSCTKTLEKYNAKMDLSIDPPMPCVQPDEVLCPCFTQEEAENLAVRLTWFGNQQRFPFYEVAEFYSVGSPTEPAFQASSFFTYTLIDFQVFEMFVSWTDFPGPRCGYTDHYLNIMRFGDFGGVPLSESHAPLSACWENLMSVKPLYQEAGYNY